MPAPSTSKRRDAERVGRLAEYVACVLLLVKGYRLLAQRFKTPAGEIDIIAKRRGVLVFAEVKFRSSTEEARLAVTLGNQKRIKAAADLYLARRARRVDVALRYDIIAVSPLSLRHISDAFR